MTENTQLQSAVGFVSPEKAQELIEKMQAEQGMVNAVTFVSDDQNPEKKKYLVLYVLVDDEGNEIKTWDIIQGRSLTYDFIKGIVNNLKDVHDESRVLVDGMTLENSGSIYDFMLHVQKNFDDEFDITNYFEALHPEE